MANLDGLTISDTGFLGLPRGSTAERPVSPSVGYLRFNTDLNVIEVFDGSEWVLNVPNHIVYEGLEFYLDEAAFEKSFSNFFVTNNLVQNGNFLGGAGSPDESGSNPTNAIIELSNPGDSPYVLSQIGTNTEYQLNYTGLSASTNYVLSGWYAVSDDYNGADTMFHSRAFSSSGAHIALGVGIGTLVHQVVVGGLIWQYRYAVITTPSDATGSFIWYVGYGTTNTAGRRYYTNLKIQKGNFPSLPDLSGNGNTASLYNGASFNSSGELSFDGVDDYVSTLLGTYTPYCIDIWFYNDDDITSSIMQGTYQTLCGVGAVPGGINLGAWTGSATDETFSFFSSGDWASNGMTYIRDVAPAGIHNIIINWNGSTYDIWLDGTKRTTYASSNGHCVLQTRTGFSLGARLNNANSYEFDGKIYSAKVYTSQLDDTSILQNFNFMRKKFGI